jgi:hypothetical protein
VAQEELANETVEDVETAELGFVHIKGRRLKLIFIVT